MQPIAESCDVYACQDLLIQVKNHETDLMKKLLFATETACYSQNDHYRGIRAFSKK
jgi:hypothetical protein